MRNTAKLGKIINAMDALREECLDAHLGATGDPDYIEVVKPMEDRIEILEDHLYRLQLALINLLATEE